MQASHRSPSWLWVIPLLMLTAALGISGLNKDAFGWDEVSSMNAVGGTTPGLSLSATWANVTRSAPDQAVGFALIFSQWGQMVGWTEFATRALPCLAGLLALAWLYRLGCDLFSPSVGLIALLVMTTSVYFSIFLHQLRVFTLIALVISLTLWCYWRVMLRPHPPGPASQIGLIVGFIGLFYTHYFATLFLGALGLYHLLFVSKTRRWWRPVLAVILAGFVFMPEFSVFLNGIAVTLDKSQLHQMAIGPLAVIYYLLLVFGNGTLLLVGLASLGIVLGLREHAQNQNLWLLLFLTLTTLLLIIAANQVLQVMTPDRVRYLMPLWPLMALGVAWGLWQYHRLRYLLLPLLLIAWVGVGLWALTASGLPDLVEAPELPWREMRADLQQMGSPDSDVFMFHGVPSRIREYYVASTIPMRREIIESWDTDESLREKLGDAARVWIGTDWRWYQEFPIDWSQQPEFHQFIDIMDQDYIYCARYIDHPFMRLDLYALSQTFCPSDTALHRNHAQRRRDSGADGRLADARHGLADHAGNPRPDLLGRAAHLRYGQSKLRQYGGLQPARWSSWAGSAEHRPERPVPGSLYTASRSVHLARWGTATGNRSGYGGVGRSASPAGIRGQINQHSACLLC